LLWRLTYRGTILISLAGCLSSGPGSSYATAALAAGIPAKIVSERLGHANVQITLDTYSHVIPGLDEQAAVTVARLILEGSETASMGVPGSDAANSAAKTGDAPHSRKEVRGEVPGELGGGGGI
jgi:hypothetical protein